MPLVAPQAQHLPSYIAALEQGWSPDTLRPQAAQEELARIRADAAAFLAGMDDREAAGPPVTLPNGTQVPRLPGFRMWMWDGSFCGSINLRWQKGTPDLPPHCLGHIGYSVVPWKRRQGHARAALAQLLPMARAVGLPYVELTTDEDNEASQRVIMANGGVLMARFIKPPEVGGKPALRYRIVFEPQQAPTRRDALGLAMGLVAGAAAVAWPVDRAHAQAAGAKPDPDPMASAKASPNDDARWLARAREMQALALSWGDQPYGAVLVLDGRAVGLGPSRVVRDRDPDAHAERVAIREAQQALGRKLLSGAVLYGTARACALCEAAAARAGVARMVHGPVLTDAGAPRLTTP